MINPMSLAFGPRLAIGGALGGFLFLTVSMILLAAALFLCAKVKSGRFEDDMHLTTHL